MQIVYNTSVGPRIITVAADPDPHSPLDDDTPATRAPLTLTERHEAAALWRTLHDDWDEPDRRHREHAEIRTRR